MSNFAKPENALKRAEELINVGQKQDALQTLHGLFTSRRHRAWQKPLERSMFKYIELCVDLRRGRFAKDGLIQYRIICQQVNVSSLEEVIKHFMHLSTERAEQARSQAQALEEALDVEDLEADKRPEDLMLSYVSGEKGKDRSDRELVTPWFKFLWETYRTVLEILRNNSKLEALYAVSKSIDIFCIQEKLTKQSVMELTLTEQLRERQEMEKKLQKLAKTMDYLERAKREEAAPLVEAAYQQRIVEERALHEHEQQQEIELSKQRHDKEVKEKERLARIKNNKEIFQERVVSHRQDEFTRLRREREEQIAQILMSRRQEREKMRKMKFYLSLEEERQKKLREEEEAQKREEAERQRKEQAERQAKLDEIAEKQRQRERELEEKERLRREALLGRPTEGPLKPSQPPTSPRPLDTGSAAVPAPAAAAAAAAPSSGKYVPRFRRGSESSGQAPPPESDRWGSSSSRQDDRMSQAGDRWRSDDRRSSGGSSFGGGGGSRSTWSSSRIPTRGSER
ncbi:eukaryotic translation initiation factor 3 subunit A-like [Quercus suber]|uniref:eukaryotic translation initiation factor 3 subunit A-like n=1 Tax=Quercus suber TaxID=58331 RepID=UPI0032E03411